MLKLDGPAAPAVYGVAALDGNGTLDSKTLTVLLASHTCPGCTPPPIQLVDFAVRGLGGIAGVVPVRASITRINATSANPKAAWESFGAPDYPTPREIAALHASSEPSVHPVGVRTLPSGDVEVTGVVLEPHTVLALKVHLQ